LAPQGDWITVKQDAHFILQKQAGKHHLAAAASSPSLRFRNKNSPATSSPQLDLGSKGHGTYRILMRCNKLCLGEFSDRNDLINQWRFLHPTDTDLAFDTTGQESMQRLWHSQMESLSLHATEQTEQDFRDQSSYLATVMTIMELTKSITPGSLNSSVEDNARMIVLLTSLSRQLLVTSRDLVDKIKASALGSDLREGNLIEETLASKLAEMEQLGFSDPIALSDDNGVSKLKASGDEMPNLSGVEALVYYVNRLFEISSRSEKRMDAVVNQVISRKSNRDFMKSDLLTNGTYYLPHVDRECKVVDRKIMLDVISDLDKSLIPPTELYERLLSHFNDRLTSGAAFPNPIGSELANSIAYCRQFIAEFSSKIKEIPAPHFSHNGPSSSSSSSSSPPPQVEDDFVVMGQQKYFDTLKLDIDQYSDLLSVGIQLSFESASSQSGGEKLAEMSRTAVKEVILAHVYPVLMTLFRAMNDEKDARWVTHCSNLRQVVTAELIDLSKDFWDVVTSPNALSEFFPICEHFVNADSVRLKYEYLHQMSVCTQTIASTGLKKIAALAGKPYDPSKPGDHLRFAVGADDFVPLFAYMLLQANIPDIHAQFAFLSVFTDENALIGHYGYLLASLQTGMMILSGLDATPKVEQTSTAPMSAPVPIQPISLIQDDSKSVSRSAFVRTHTSTANMVGADPLSRDDWDSDGNISDGTPSSLSSSPFAYSPSRKAGANSSRHVTIKNSGSMSQLITEDDMIPGGLKSVSSSPGSDAAPGSFSRIPSSAVLKEKEMPPIVILNSPYENPGHTGPPLVGDHAYSLSLKVFTLLLCLYQRYENRLLAQGPASNSAASAKNDEILKNYKEEIQQLRRVQLMSMSETQRMVFFVNIYHALLMHAFLENEMPDSLHARLSIMARSAYLIGDMTFTLLEIEHGILRHWSPYPTELLDGMFHFPAKWKTSDWPKASLASKRADPRLNFILAPFAPSGPPLRILTTETAEHVLQTATESFLRKNVLVSADNAVIILPKQLLWYSREFGKRGKNLIDWVSRYLEPSQQEILMSVKKDSLRIKYNEFDWTFDFSFENIPDQ
jgi:hypothetical protein